MVGGAVGSLGAAGPRRRNMVLLCAAVAAAPDLDVLGFFLGVPYAHPLGHRGLTHSVPFALAVGLTTGLWFRRRAYARPGWCGILVGLACISHGVLDGLTDAGLGVGFAVPFSDTRWFWPWRPIMTSALDPRAVFSSRGMQILLNEALWIALPTLLLLMVRTALRKNRRSSL